MKTSTLAVLFALAAFAAILATTSLNAADTAEVTDANVEQMVANAKTAQDHEAIAAYYDRAAAAADEQVKLHEHLLEGYKKMPRFSTMAMHCDRMVRAYKSAAGENRALADEHRKMAKAAEH